jgi:hypothetical protein
MMQPQLKIRTALEPGEFSAVMDGHVLATERIEPGTLDVCRKFDVVCMFGIWEVRRDQQLCGFYFHSGFQVENKGGYILTFMESKRGKASAADLVLRNDKDGLIVYSFDGCGAIAISTKVSKFVLGVFDTQ